MLRALARDTSPAKRQNRNQRKKPNRTKPTKSPSLTKRANETKRNSGFRDHTVCNRETKTSRTEFNSYHIINCIPLYVSQEK